MIMPVKYTDSIIAEALDMRAKGIKNVVIVETFGPGIDQAIRKYKARCANQIRSKRMSKTIEISRELAERLLNWDVDGIRAVSELRAILAAPVVERQDSVVTKCQGCNGSGRLCMAGCSAHQSNWYDCESCGGTGKPPAPVAVAPDAWIVVSPDGKEFSELQSSRDHAVDLAHDMDNELHGSHEGDTHKVRAIYFSGYPLLLPPARDFQCVSSGTFENGWNACLDKAKELNQ